LFIQGMKQAGAKNPVFLLDELDKLGVSVSRETGGWTAARGPRSGTNDIRSPGSLSWAVPFDLSEVLFVATANFRRAYQVRLLDPPGDGDFAGYTEREKARDAKRYLVRDSARKTV